MQDALQLGYISIQIQLRLVSVNNSQAAAIEVKIVF